MEDTLIHYGVKGMKWGIRKAKHYRNATERNIATANQNRAEARANDAYSRKLARTPLTRTTGKLAAKFDNRVADFYEKRAQKYMTKFLKTKVDLMAATQTVKNGRDYIDDIVDLRLDPERILARQQLYAETHY